MSAPHDPPPPSSADASASAPSASDGLEQLRRLLFTPEQRQIAALQRRLDEPALHAADVSRVLAEAVALRATHDDALGPALQSTVQEALRISVRRNPAVLVEALFPLMGPAIRKAIGAALGAMLQSLNQTLEQSFSLRGLQWRLEAARAGRPFAEVVLLHTLVYRVEQAFLVHRRTGLPLVHRVAPGVAMPDSGMVSGMLTAIQDFVLDSFSAQRTDGLEALQVGELSVWIERGPHADLAAVVRGQPPQSLRPLLQEALERIHLDQGDALEAFDGDAAPLAACEESLDACMQTEYAPARSAGRRRPSPMAIVGAAAVLALVVWGGFWLRDQRRWTAYVDALRREPGIVVTDAGTQGGKRFVTGLRDPMAADPGALAAAAGLEPGAIAGRWEPYHVLAPAFVLARATAVLQPPGTVTLTLRDGVLAAEGHAPHAWRLESRRLARVIPGVASFRDDALVDADLWGLKRDIERRIVLFPPGRAVPTAGQGAVIQALAAEVKRLQQLAGAAGPPVRLEVLGHTDRDASPAVNQRLSRQRAESVARLIDLRASPTLLTAVTGAGSDQPLRVESSDEDKRMNRSVSFRVTLGAAAGPR